MINKFRFYAPSLWIDRFAMVHHYAKLLEIGFLHTLLWTYRIFYRIPTRLPWRNTHYLKARVCVVPPPPLVAPPTLQPL